MTVEELLERKFNAGSRVINCVPHSGLDLTRRPDDCRLCQTDIRNQLSLCIRVNEWLNEWKNDAEELLKEKK